MSQRKNKKSFVQASGVHGVTVKGASGGVLPVVCFRWWLGE
jgi:hypothetical protein